MKTVREIPTPKIILKRELKLCAKKLPLFFLIVSSIIHIGNHPFNNHDGNHDMETFSALLVLCVTVGFPSQGTSVLWVCCLLSRLPEQAIGKLVKFTKIWGAMTLMWRNHYGACPYRTSSGITPRNVGCGDSRQTKLFTFLKIVIIHAKWITGHGFVSGRMLIAYA